jgi:hypothetical protein
MNKPLGRQAARKTIPLAVLCLALTLGGCAFQSAPIAFRYDAAGIPKSFKRVERFPQCDYVHHFVRQAYLKTGANFAPKDQTGQTSATAKSDQLLTFEEWGKPDYIRKPFRSLDNERVEEWIYLDRVHIFQFIGNQLVFEGPLSDYEQVLLRKGYPDKSFQTRYETGTDEDVFIYHTMFAARLEEFHFMDGVLTQSQEGS